MAKSKVAKIKEEMMWQKSGPTCGNCKFFTSEMIEKENRYYTWREEKKKKCTLGGFATGKVSWCAKHEFASSSSPTVLIMDS